MVEMEFLPKKVFATHSAAIHLVPSVPKDFSVAIHCMCFLCSSVVQMFKKKTTCFCRQPRYHRDR